MNCNANNDNEFIINGWDFGFSCGSALYPLKEEHGGGKMHSGMNKSAKAAKAKNPKSL